MACKDTGASGKIRVWSGPSDMDLDGQSGVRSVLVSYYSGDTVLNRKVVGRWKLCCMFSIFQGPARSNVYSFLPVGHG